MLVKCGKDIELNVDLSRFGLVESELHPVAKHAVYMGLRNILMDAHASHTKDQADFLEKSRAASQAKLASMYAGEVRAVGERTTNPLAREIHKIAVQQVMDAFRAYCRANGKKMRDIAPEQIKEGVRRHIEKNLDSLRKTAEKNLKNVMSTVVDMEGVI